MEKKISTFSWQTKLKNLENVYSIDQDFMLIDQQIIPIARNLLFRLDFLVAVICTKGTYKGHIDLIEYQTQVPGMIIILPGQILQCEYISDDFEGKFVIMSKRFTESLNIEERLPVFFSVRNNPSLPLTQQELDAILNYYTMMQNTIKVKENPYRMEIAKNLTRAFFYGAGYFFHKTPQETKKSGHELLLENFLNLVQANYKEQRGTDFYANQLCLTPKYLSTAIKRESGKSANEWIDDYVTLEAKALLKSTNMTIQQISDELNFPSQSFFGKYFKRIVGISPKEYRSK